MKIRSRLGVVVAALVLGVAPAIAVASKGSGKPVAAGHSTTPGPNASMPAKAKAYGKFCQAESKKHVAGKTGTPFSECVTAMAKLATNKSMTPARACATLSKRHVAGMKGTPYSQCVIAAAHLRGNKTTAHGASAAAMAVAVPRSALEAHAPAGAACVLPDGSGSQNYHCYTPQQIRDAYGVTSLEPNYGAGQTIVLVDAYGSPTAAADLSAFHQQFFPNLPAPSFKQIFPQGNPQYNNTCTSNGLSGPCAAAGWSGEATLDIEWAYSIAPEANIVLLAVPPAETEGVQGLPNLFKAISGEIAATPPGTVFSMSFSATEQTFGGAGPSQTAKLDQVFQQGLAKHDNFFAATGDYGSQSFTKQAKEGNLSTYPVVGYPSTSPYVVAVGGTQLQYNWTWDPTSNDPSTSGYWNSSAGGNTNTVWNESWAPIGTGGGSSVIYQRPSWQKSVDPGYGNHRLVPDTAWNAAVNGGVDVYITAYPEYNCGNATGCWTFFGGTSAATPQTAALVALANAARTADGKGPIGFLDPILYSGVGAGSAYTDVIPQHQGSAPTAFAGSQVGVAGPVNKSVGDLEDNQLWGSSVPGYQTTPGYDATTGWGTPNASEFVSALTGQP